MLVSIGTNLDRLMLTLERTPSFRTLSWQPGRYKSKAKVPLIALPLDPDARP